ncbi:tailspike protein II [Acinetobacter phage TaPaz]|nr:tailspike protein II [Acinetobacter phage TaPaz]
MADLRIADAPEIALENITGNEKIPTGGYGNSAVTINNLGQFAKTALSLATEEYVNNLSGQKEVKITLTGNNLTPTSSNDLIPQLNNSVLNIVHQKLLNKIEWVKDNVSVITDHQALQNRNVSNTHPSTSISHNVTSNVSVEIENIKNDVLRIETETIPELSNSIVGKQDVIVNDINLTPSATLSNVQSTNNAALNNSLQALLNRDQYRSIHNNLTGRDVENAHPTTSIYDGNETQKQINDKTIVSYDTVGDLRNIVPRKNGQVVHVKSHSNNNSGGLNYIWNSDNSLPDDDGYIIQSATTSTGRWVAQFGKSPITPRHFGAKGDGVSDERLMCEKSLVVATNLGNVWLVEKGSTYLLNSYANYSSIAAFSSSMLPLFSKSKVQIDGTLKVGSFFNDKDFIVFTDINAASSSNFTPVKNWEIYGAGDIDLSLSGKRETTYKLRIPIYLETSYESSIKDIKIHSGDTPNAIVTGGKNITIDNVKFIDLMSDNSSNDDHSTIYAKAEETKIRNCHFEMTTVNGHLNACPVELHNSNSYFKDSVIVGYRNTHIIAAITTEFANIYNIEICGLKSKVYRGFSTLDVWTGASLINAKIHDNQCQILPFPSDAEITNAGIDASLVDGPQTMLLVTNDSAIGYDLVSGIGSYIQYYNNTYISESDVNVPDNLRSAIYFSKAPLSGLEFYRNSLKVKYMVLGSDGVQTTDKLNLDRFIFKENDFDESFLVSNNPFNLNVNKIQSTTLSFIFKRLYSCTNLVNMAVSDFTNSIVNNFNVYHENTGNIVKCFNITTSVLENNSNKLSYPETIGVYFSADTLGDSDFYKNNIKRARIIDRGQIPDNVVITDFLSNVNNNRLVAMCKNPTGQFGTFNCRLMLEN